MPIREQLERLALLATVLLLAAFAVSFGLGLLRPATPQQGYAGVEPARVPAVAPASVPRGRVEVLNASGRSGVARRATERLRSGGFDVVYFGTARLLTDTSEVVDRIGQLEIARAAAERLGIQRVRTAIDTTRFLDATVRIGRDWHGVEAPASDQPRGWWNRVRGWLGAG